MLAKTINNRVDIWLGLNPEYRGLNNNVAKQLQNTLYWVIDILELTWNENKNDLWLNSGWEINQEWYLLNWEIFDGIEDIISIKNWSIAIVYKLENRVFWIHATKIANDFQQFLLDNQQDEDQKEDIDLKPIDKTFEKVVKVRQVIDLKTWNKFQKLFDLEKYIIENSKKDIVDGNYFESEKNEAFKKLYKILSNK